LEVGRGRMSGEGKKKLETRARGRMDPGVVLVRLRSELWFWSLWLGTGSERRGRQRLKHCQYKKNHDVGLATKP
jgi:hypothetical protein